MVNGWEDEFPSKPWWPLAQRELRPPKQKTRNLYLILLIPFSIFNSALSVGANLVFARPKERSQGSPLRSKCTVIFGKWYYTRHYTQLYCKCQVASELTRNSHIPSDLVVNICCLIGACQKKSIEYSKMPFFMPDCRENRQSCHRGKSAWYLYLHES